MDQITILYLGKVYSCDIIINRDQQPTYCWIVFKDQELIKILGEDISFVVHESFVIGVNPPVAEHRKPLYAVIENAVYSYFVN